MTSLTAFLGVMFPWTLSNGDITMFASNKEKTTVECEVTDDKTSLSSTKKISSNNCISVEEFFKKVIEILEDEKPIKRRNIVRFPRIYKTLWESFEFSKGKKECARASWGFHEQLRIIEKGCAGWTKNISVDGIKKDPNKVVHWIRGEKVAVTRYLNRWGFLMGNLEEKDGKMDWRMYKTHCHGNFFRQRDQVEITCET
ncbi:hypothetical protein [Mycoplasma suis]|uniref:Uncharacterized protein n=1 Tax=Mycoplasma suis (strain Illinois) TaxID=768700 RepID=F0QR11_MYCSL|nr:hypothetical protein [Mycoplasma suis]ADX97931.1 hypothetical protein MSU_0394 [Mycoplasma suis str. Illinois]